MQIKLEAKQDFHLLQVQGELNENSAQVLHAGISKLLRTGKDKIALELGGTALLPDSFTQELVSLHGIARELGGEIVICLNEPRGGKLRASLGSAKLVVVQSVAEAAEQFARALAVKAPELSTEAQAILRERDAKIANLEKRVAALDPSQLRSLQSELENVRNENLVLKNQVLSLMEERRIPPDAEAVKERIQGFEKLIQELHNTLEKGAHAKK